MTRIRFTTGTPAEARSAIEPYLSKWLGLVPTWCHELVISWKDDDTDGALSVVPLYDYRRAEIDVLPNFLTSPEECREQDSVHELMHVPLAPLMAVVEGLRDALVKQAPEMETWANEMIRQGEEATVCDLTQLVMGIR